MKAGKGNSESVSIKTAYGEAFAEQGLLFYCYRFYVADRQSLFTNSLNNYGIVSR